jgi:hypothetical protein
MPIPGLVLPQESDRPRSEKYEEPTRCLDGSMTLRSLVILRLDQRPILRERRDQDIVNLADGGKLGDPGITGGHQDNDDDENP